MFAKRVSLALLRKHFWSTASLTLTLLLYSADRFAMDYIGRLFGFTTRYSALPDWIEGLLAWGMLMAVALALVGLVKEPRPWLALVAFCLSGTILFGWAMTA